MLNKSLLFKSLILIFFCCTSAGPYVVVENYGNWKTLSIASKSAYVTGLWDGYIFFSRDEITENYNTICGEASITRISDLVEVIDILYEEEINRSFSPAILLKEKGLQYLCRN